MKSPKSSLDSKKPPRLFSITEEAKMHLTPSRVDFGAIEAEVMDRAEREEQRLGSASTSKLAWIGALAVAASVAAVFVSPRDHGSALVDDGKSAAPEMLAGSLRTTEGPGDVRVGGVNAFTGHTLRAGDVIEAEGARAVFERPRKVVWLLEHEGGSARARIASVGESLVVDLVEGAIEAQVTPVPSGEAFAVDVSTATGRVRIAVHGTHLRVTRQASRVVIDLTEGVVSIGSPPRSGVTFGKLVTAPAHVELDPADVEHSLRVEHAASAVRVAVPLAMDEPAVILPAKEGAPQPGAGVAPLLPSPARNRATPPTETASAPKAEAPKTVRPPREAILAAVRDCAAQSRNPSDVRVTVTSALHLKIGATGQVESAQFDPPLLPQIQTCASNAIYNVAFEERGALDLPIEFSY